MLRNSQKDRRRGRTVRARRLEGGVKGEMKKVRLKRVGGARVSAKRGLK